MCRVISYLFIKIRICKWITLTIEHEFMTYITFYRYRNYYKCTNPRCSAKKQVERSNDDPDTLIITYEGLHLHYMFPYFIFGQCENVDPPTKKSRKHNHEATTVDQIRPTSHDSEESKRHDCLTDQPSSTIVTAHEPQVEFSSQGLLEDMVPLFIRNPITSFKSCSWSPEFWCLLNCS